jgi:hypothetical protein
LFGGQVKAKDFERNGARPARVVGLENASGWGLGKFADNLKTADLTEHGRIDDSLVSYLTPHFFGGATGKE